MDDRQRVFSRREFLELSAAGVGAAALMAPLAGCSSTQAAAPLTDEQFWLAVRRNDFTLSPDYIYLNNSTLGATLKSVRERMAQVGRIFGDGCYLDRWVNEIIRQLAPMLASYASLVNAPTSPTSAWIRPI